MKRIWLLAASAACVLVFAVAAQAQNSAGSGQGADTSSDPAHWYSPSRLKVLNPVPYVKKPIDHFRKDSSRSASEELAANADEDKRLTTELQYHGLLPAKTDARDACSAFKGVDDCIAAIHASHNVGVKFVCLKWNVTAVKPDGAAKACSEPDSDKPMTLERAIRALKPDADAREEAKNALRQARENITDARS